MTDINTPMNPDQDCLDLNAFKKAVSKCAHEHGWWDVKDPYQASKVNGGPVRNMGEMIALMHSELSEALEAWREHDNITEIRYEYPNGDNGEVICLYAPHFLRDDGEGNSITELGKPVGVASEFADVIIRILDTCDTLNIPITEALIRKHQYNLSRPYRHGGKLA
jgi:NTP pyrophosphatase (non-canonical NTP hydrolase)